jgi:hypothetical protein
MPFLEPFMNHLDNKRTSSAPYSDSEYQALSALKSVMDKYPFRYDTVTDDDIKASFNAEYINAVAGYNSAIAAVKTPASPTVAEHAVVETAYEEVNRIFKKVKAIEAKSTGVAGLAVALPALPASNYVSINPANILAANFVGQKKIHLDEYQKDFIATAGRYRTALNLPSTVVTTLTQFDSSGNPFIDYRNIELMEFNILAGIRIHYTDNREAQQPLLSEVDSKILSMDKRIQGLQRTKDNEEKKLPLINAKIAALGSPPDPLKLAPLQDELDSQKAKCNALQEQIDQQRKVVVALTEIQTFIGEEKKLWDDLIKQKGKYFSAQKSLSGSIPAAQQVILKDNLKKEKAAYEASIAAYESKLAQLNTSISDYNKSPDHAVKFTTRDASKVANILRIEGTTKSGFTHEVIENEGVVLSQLPTGNSPGALTASLGDLMQDVTLIGENLEGSRLVRSSQLYGPNSYYLAVQNNKGTVWDKSQQETPSQKQSGAINTALMLIQTCPKDGKITLSGSDKEKSEMVYAALKVIRPDIEVINTVPGAEKPESRWKINPMSLKSGEHYKNFAKEKLPDVAVELDAAKEFAKGLLESKADSSSRTQEYRTLAQDGRSSTTKPLTVGEVLSPSTYKPK